MNRNYEEEYRQYVSEVSKKMAGCNPLSYERWLKYEKEKEQQTCPDSSHS